MKTRVSGLIVLSLFALYIALYGSSAQLTPSSQTAAVDTGATSVSAPATVTSGGTTISEPSTASAAPSGETSLSKPGAGMVPPSCKAGSQAANQGCPEEDAKHTYACDVSQGNAPGDPAKKCVMNLACSQPVLDGVAIAGKCKCPKDCRGDKIQVAGPNQPSPVAKPPSSGQATDVSSPSKPPVVPPTSGTTNVTNPIGSGNTPSQTPASASGAPASGATAVSQGTGVSGASTDQQLSGLANPNTGSGLPPAPPGSGQVQSFSGTPGLSRPTSLGAGSVAPSSGGTTAPSGGYNSGAYQPGQSTFGSGNSAGYVPPSRPSYGGYSAPSISSYVSSFSSMSFFNSFGSLFSAFVQPTYSYTPPTPRVIVVRPPVVVISENQSQQDQNVPGQPYRPSPGESSGFGDGSAQLPVVQVHPPAHPTIDEITALMREGLFSGVTIVDLSSSTSRVRYANGTPTSPRDITLQGSHTSGVDVPVASAMTGGDLVGTSFSSSTPEAPAFGSDVTLKFKDAIAVDIATSSRVGEAWSLTVRNITNGLSGNWVDPSSPLVEKEAALSQVQSNYEAMRAQIADLQEVKDRGMCDESCMKSLEFLTLKLPLQRAGVNALNKSIDEEISRISQKTFTKELPVANLQEENIPPTPPDERTNDTAVVPADLSGLALVPEIGTTVFGAGAEGGGGSVIDMSIATSTVAQDPFKQPIFVLDDPWLFTSERSADSAGFQSLADEGTFVQSISNLWQKIMQWFTPASQKTKQSCSLLRSLFGMCQI